jgi:hypothetical protein
VARLTGGPAASHSRGLADRLGYSIVGSPPFLTAPEPIKQDDGTDE